MSHVRRSRRLSALLPVTLLAIAAGSFDWFDRSHATEPADRIAASAPPSSTALIAAGREQFTRLRHAEPAVDADFGAHRLFNARSCAECHKQGGVGGAGPSENNVRLFNLPFYFDGSLSLLAQFGPPHGVAVVHHRGLAPGYAAWRLALIEKFDLRDPDVAPWAKYRLSNLIAPELPEARSLFNISFEIPPAFERRNTPPLFGLGLIESIPQSEIDAVAAAQPKELRGRSPRLKGGGRGRFGWKAGTATLAAFNENACAVELGLSTPKFQPATFYAAPVPIAAGASTPTAPPDHALTPDMSDADLAALNRFVASLPAPRQVVDASEKAIVAAGLQHFNAIGCAQCHRPNLGGVTGLYSDLLLHSIGTSGGGFYGKVPTEGGEPQFDIVEAHEFRTPPLWGVADSGPYLQDGSAPTLDDAIRRHSVQAHASKYAYETELRPHQRHALLRFLESLRAP